MNTELVAASRIFPFHEPMEERRSLQGREFAVVRYLGLHCGAGGQVVLQRWLREAAAGTARLGLVEIWYRCLPGIGLTGPFFGLTDRGRQLAAALLREHRNRRPTDGGPSKRRT